MNRLNQTVVLIGVATALTIACQPAAHADVGVPMLALMAVPMWLSLLVIIPIEAVLAKRIIGLNWRTSFKISTFANLSSTFLGIPGAWLLLAFCEVALYLAIGILASMTHALEERTAVAPLSLRQKLILTFFTSPWLLPIASDLYWMTPVAALLLCIPFFLISVWWEKGVAQKMVTPDLSAQVNSWAWKANAASYLLMVLTIIWILITSISQHKAEENSERHRNVDTVSVERLWTIAVQDKAERKRSFDSNEKHSPSDDENDPYAKAMGKVTTCLSENRIPEAKQLLEASFHAEEKRLASGRLQLDYPMYDLRLGDVYLKLGELKSAERFYQRVISSTERFGDNECLKRALISYADLCVGENRGHDAEELYRKAASSQNPNSYTPERERALTQLSEYLCSKSRSQEAERMLTEAIKNKESVSLGTEFSTHPEDAVLGLALANCYLSDGNLTLAEHWIKQSMRGGEVLSDAARSFALLLRKQGKTSESKVWLDRAQQTDGM